jgi:hypothetical protein
MTTTNTAAHSAATTTDYNSTTNQQIKQKFVDRNVLACASYLMDELFKAGQIISSKDAELPQYEDIENYFSYPEWNKTVLGEDLYFEGGTENDKEAFLQEFERLENESLELYEADKISEATHDRNIGLIEEARNEFEELETEPADIFEWWIVDSWFYEKLQQQCQPVLEYGNLYFWGRCTTGQAILLDYVISRICEGMEILEGQKNDWSK